MDEGVVRSGRRRMRLSRLFGPATVPGPAVPDPCVVVVGTGPVATAIAAWFSRPPAAGEVRALDEVPEWEPEHALIGASTVVVVLDGGDLTATWAVAPEVRHVHAVAHMERLLAGARAVRVPHVVVISSAMVNGATAGRAVITDDDDLLPDTETAADGIVADLVAVERILAGRPQPGDPRVTVLRPAAVVGPEIDTLVSRHFEAPRLLTVRGGDREWQFVHVDDVAAAAAFAVEHALTGVLTVGSGGALTSAQVELASSMRRVALSPATAFGTAERLHRVGVLPAPAGDLAYAVYSWTVSSGRLLAAGWRPQWSNDQCLEVLLETVRGRHALAGRRVGPRDAAALGAAGAAMALIGTAALMRQARGRRR
jgi:UDP-glucose 4-epimerase